MLTVVKVGGSFAHSPRLPELVAALQQGAGRIVVVPGGGPFADCVRREQARMGYGEPAAHRMALLAMAQFGLALASLSSAEAESSREWIADFLSPPGRGRLVQRAGEGQAAETRRGILVPAASIDAIHAALGAGRVPVWLPLDLLDGDPHIPESWDVTSDSLAAWLAGRLAAACLVYMKSVDAPASTLAADLAAAGVLDPLAPRFLAEAGVDAWLCGPHDIPRLGAALAARESIGRRIGVA